MSLLDDIRQKSINATNNKLASTGLKVSSAGNGYTVSANTPAGSTKLVTMPATPAPSGSTPSLSGAQTPSTPSNSSSYSSGIAPGTQVGVPANTYRVQSNGKAPVGLSAGDSVVTGGGTYRITGVNPDGTYQSQRVSDVTTSTYTGSYGNTVTRPDGVTQKAFDWAYDPTDYAAKALGSDSAAAFNANAQSRVNQAAAQGRDISGYGSEPSNAQLYNEWWNTTGRTTPSTFKASDGTTQQGYYGMDGSGNWGYYLDPELTQKHPNGRWDDYKASDGGLALFDTSKGYLWPSQVADMSRAGQTVTLTAGQKAYAVTYNPNGTISSVVNLSNRGVDGRTLDLPTARSLNDQGAQSRDLMRQSIGVDYAGAGSGIRGVDIPAATRGDYNALAGGGQTAPGQTGGYAGAYPSGGAYDSESAYPGGYSGDYGGQYGGEYGGQYGSQYGGEYGGQYGSQYGGQYGGQYSWNSELTDELRRLYDEQNSRYQAMLEEQRRAKEAAVERAVNSLEGQKRSANQSYADLFRQLYIDRMNNEKNIGQRMAAQGMTGGAAESTLLGLGTQYEDALRQGEQSRIGTIDNIDQAIADARLNGDMSIAEQTANLMQQNIDNYANALRTLIAQQNTDRAFNYQVGRDEVSDSQWGQEFGLRQQQLAYQQQQAARQMAYQQEQNNYARQMQLAQLQYQQQQDEYARLLELANLGAKYGDYSGLNNLGIDTGSYAAALAAQQASPTLSAAQVTSAIRNNTVTPSVLSAYEHYYGVPYGSEGTTPYTAYAAGGDRYTIGSTTGVNFVRSAKPGATLTGGDGSQWVKNADGSVTISKNGKTYKVG